MAPRTRRQGLRWWEERIRRIDAGARSIAPERLLTVSLDELLLLGPVRASRPLCRFLEIWLNKRMRRYFRRRMNAELANAARWRRGISNRRAAALEHAYEAVVAGLEADGVRCAPLLRHTLERSQSPEPELVEPLPFIPADGAAAEVGA